MVIGILAETIQHLVATRSGYQGVSSNYMEGNAGRAY